MLHLNFNVMKRIALVLLFFTVLSFCRCTKKSNCAYSDGDYHTGYFTYFDEKVTVTGLNGKRTNVNGIFLYEEYYPTCTIGILKRSIPMDFRNDGEEIYVGISKQSLKHDYFGEIQVYDLSCIEKID